MFRIAVVANVRQAFCGAYFGEWMRVWVISSGEFGKFYYFSAVLTRMAKHHADFTLLAIDINDSYVNKVVTEADVVNPKDFSWQFSYDFEFADYTEDHEKVVLHFWFELARNADDTVMTTIDITNTFQVTAGIANEAKTEILKLFFDTSITNIQGIFAALTERSSLGKLMFNDIDSEKYTSNLEQIVQDDWWRL